MKIDKHFSNIFLMVVFGLMVVLPFGMTNVSFEEGNVLGEFEERSYYKKVLASNENILVRSMSKKDGYEKDFITILVAETGGPMYMPLYQITNLSDEVQHFIIYPDGDVVGSMRNKRISLRLQESNYANVVFYYNSNELQGDPEIRFRLKPKETEIVSIVVETAYGLEERPVSFDLVLEKE